MKQRTLAMTNGFERYSKKTRRAAVSGGDGAGGAVGGVVRADRAGVSQGGATGGNRWEWSGCCGFIFCSSGSTCRTRRWRKRCTTRRSMRQFAGIDLGSEPVPDETTVCKFRHLLEQHELGSGCSSG